MCKQACLIFFLIQGIAQAANDKAQANSYDDAWEKEWVAHCRSIYRAAAKTAGFVLQIGDNFTHSNPNSSWPRQGAGKTSEDEALCKWCYAGLWNISAG